MCNIFLRVSIELYVQSLVLKYDFKNKIQMITYCCFNGIINTFEGSKKTSNIKHQTSNIKHQTSNEFYAKIVENFHQPGAFQLR